MTKHPLPIALILAMLLFAAGCGRKEEPAVARPDDPWAAFPFVRHAPGATEAFIAVRRPAEIWRQFASAWDPVLSDPGLHEWWRDSAAGTLAAAFLAAPRTPALLEALTEAAEHEMFVLCGPGTGSQLASLQQVKRLFEAARLRNLFTPWPAGDATAEMEFPLEGIPEDPSEAAFTEIIVPLPPAMQETLETFAREAAVPPLLIGMKIPPDAALPRLLEEWAASLPEKIPRDHVDAAGKGAFTRVRLPVTMFVPSAVALRARDILAASIGDVYAATYLVRDLLSKVTVLGFGRLHGWFVISVGPASGFPELAASPASSLAAEPALRKLEPLLGENAEAILYADRLVVGLAAAPPPIPEYLDAAVESALEFAPAEKIQRLRAQAAPLREKAAELFRPRTSPLSGILQGSSDGWRAELFGGSSAPRLASGNAVPIIGRGTDVDVLWTENWEEGYAQRLAEFAGGLAAFAGDWIDALGPVFLDGKSRAAADAAMRVVGGSMGHLEQKAGALVGNSLGPQVALAVSLDGAMPPPPMLPAAAGKAILPRIAAVAALRDREALARSWEKLTAVDPQKPWLPPAGTTESDGSVSYQYSLPSGGPDLGVAVTIAGNRWLLGNSLTYNEAISAAPAGDARTVQTIEFSTAAIATFAAAWSDALGADPSLAPLTAGLIPDDPRTLSAFAAVCKTPRRFRYEAKWDQDMIHRVLELAPAP